MHNDRYRFGLWDRACFKNAFGGSAPAAPPPPTPVAPPPLPDPNNPAALAAQRLAQQRANQSGRSSTMLTTIPTLAAGSAYGGQKTGG